MRFAYIALRVPSVFRSWTLKEGGCGCGSRGGLVGPGFVRVEAKALRQEVFHGPVDVLEGAGELVPFVGVRLVPEEDAGVGERLRERDPVLVRRGQVGQPVHQVQRMRGHVPGPLRRVRLHVPLIIVRRQPEYSFRERRICNRKKQTETYSPTDGRFLSTLTVIQPVGDWRDGDSATEDLLLGPEHHRRDVPAVAPAPDADPRPVEELHRLEQVVQHGYLVLHLDAAQVPVQRPRSHAAGAANVQAHVHDVRARGHVRPPIDAELLRDRLATRPSIPGSGKITKTTITDAVVFTYTSTKTG